MPSDSVPLTDTALAASTSKTLVVSAGPGAVPLTPATLTYDAATETLSIGAKAAVPTVDHGTQTGTLADPTLQTLHRIENRDPALGAYSCLLGGGLSDTVYNPIIHHGFNNYRDPAYTYQADQPTVTYNIEYDFLEQSTGYRVIESYLDIIGAEDLGDDRWNVRPWFSVTDRDTGSTRFHIQLGKKQASSALFDVSGGSRTFGGTNTEYQILQITGGDTIADATTEFFGVVTIDGALNLNTATAACTIAGSLRTGTASDVETYIGPTQYDGFGRIIVGLSQRLGNFNTLIGKNLKGVNGSTSYVTPSTSAPWSGYGGIEFGSTGDIIVYASNASTTAGATVVPKARLTISGSNGAATFGGTVLVSGLQNGNQLGSSNSTTTKSIRLGQNDAYGFLFTEETTMLLGANGTLSPCVAIVPGAKLVAGRGGLGNAAAMVEAVAPDGTTNQFAGYSSGSATPSFVVGPSGSIAVGGGTAVLKILSASGTLDFPSTASQNSSDLTLSVTGAAVGNVVALGLPASPPANTSFSAWVSAADTVIIRFNNYSSGAVDPASGTYRVQVTKF